MGLEKIRQTVLDEAKAEAKHITEAAQKQSASHIAYGKEEIKKEAEWLYKTRALSLEEEFNRRLIQFKGSAGKQILEKRNALISSLFDQARQKILAWPEDTYAQVMGRLIKKVSGDLSGKIQIHPEENQVFSKVLPGINATRDEAKITIDEAISLPERGGFIFARADFDVDQTLSTLLREIEYQILPVIAKELFEA
jgi:vacuolar-type H+-ATPase subunit E/Vma4